MPDSPLNVTVRRLLFILKRMSVTDGSCNRVKTHVLHFEPEVTTCFPGATYVKLGWALVAFDHSTPFLTTADFASLQSQRHKTIAKDARIS